MTINNLVESTAWKHFQAEARKHHRDPAEMVAEYMNRCLEVWADEAVDEEVNAEMRSSGYTEDDAVEIVRQYRREKRGERAAS